MLPKAGFFNYDQNYALCSIVITQMKIISYDNSSYYPFKVMFVCSFLCPLVLIRPVHLHTVQVKI
jgi:hypothetical protein